MNFKDFIPLITAIISILGAYITAKLTAKSEFKKLTTQQSHEIRLNAIQAFSKMKSAVNTYTSTPIPKYRREALAAVGAFTPYASEKMLIVCSSLENALNANKPSIVDDFMNRLSSEWLSEQPAKKNNKR